MERMGHQYMPPCNKSAFLTSIVGVLSIYIEISESGAKANDLFINRPVCSTNYKPYDTVRH